MNPLLTFFYGIVAGALVVAVIELAVVDRRPRPHATTTAPAADDETVVPAGPGGGQWRVVDCESMYVASSLVVGGPPAMLVRDRSGGVMVRFDAAERALALAVALRQEAERHLAHTPRRLRAVPDEEGVR